MKSPTCGHKHYYLVRWFYEGTSEAFLARGQEARREWLFLSLEWSEGRNNFCLRNYLMTQKILMAMYFNFCKRETYFCRIKIIQHLFIYLFLHIYLFLQLPHCQRVLPSADLAQARSWTRSCRRHSRSTWPGEPACVQTAVWLQLLSDWLINLKMN